MHPSLLLSLAAAVPAPVGTVTPTPTISYTTATVTEDLFSACTTTLMVFPPPLDLSNTKTVYSHTITSYSAVDCKGCELKVQRLNLGPGPVIPGGKKVTVTEATTTTVAFACSTTAY
ncbi:hypothetical protein ABW19_dt0206847 [Dactylella cylindrospora]|nr:hypothetical protein ABW19_dt0206847 [Dactylella cylindrospora]